MADENEKKVYKRKRSTAQSKFTRISNQFQVAIAKNEDIDTLQGLLADVEPAFTNLEEKNTDY